jgi:hypothetical protein
MHSSCQLVRAPGWPRDASAPRGVRRLGLPQCLVRRLWSNSLAAGDVRPYVAALPAWTVGGMFVAEELTVSTGSSAAQARFENLVHGDWLAGASEAAYDGAVTGLLRVGPAGQVAAKLVRVAFLDPVYRGDVMTIGMRWEAAGATSTLFPVLDANITISPAGDQTARLALAGSYRPPLGRLGAGVDRAVMHQVAAATMRSLLRNVATALTSPAWAGHPAAEARPGLHPAPEPGMA